MHSIQDILTSAGATHWELASANTISTYWSTDNGQNWQLAA